MKKIFLLLSLFTIGLTSLSAQFDDDFGNDSGNDPFGDSGNDGFGGGTDDGFGGGTDDGFGDKSLKAAPVSIDALVDSMYKDKEVLYAPDGSKHGDPRRYVEPQFVNKDTLDAVTNGRLNVIQRPHLIESDIKFRKRIWRRLDLNHKENLVFRWPGSPFTKIIYELATDGVVPCYYTDSFEFSIQGYMSPENMMKRLGYIVNEKKLPPGIDPNTATPDDYEITPTPNFYKHTDILMFEIMEDWVFDYKHGSFEPIIIGIAPVVIKGTVQDAGVRDLSVTHEPLFWLKMEDLRPTLAQSEVFNRYNDAMKSNWDRHINVDRRFDSYIVKESNVYNQYIAQRPEFIADRIAAKLEGDKIKNDLFVFEHDLFEY
jgi:gliding motility associated protien GldN